MSLYLELFMIYYHSFCTSVKRVVGPVMLFGFEVEPLTERQEAEPEVAELKMLRVSLGVTGKDRIRNKHINGTVNVRGSG